MGSNAWGLNHMLDEIKRLFAALSGDDDRPGRLDAGDYRVAAASLLVHVAMLDGELSAPERQLLRQLLAAQFALTDALADEVIAAAVTADREAVDFYRFTSLLMRKLDETDRLRLVEMLWEMVYVDGKVSEFEDNTIWRVADLLGVSQNERIALRQHVAATQANRGQPWMRLGRHRAAGDHHHWSFGRHRGRTCTRVRPKRP